MVLSKEDIRNLYYYLLDRDVESLETLNKLSSLDSVSRLRNMILCSPEFKRKNSDIQKNYFADTLITNFPPMDIEFQDLHIENLFTHIQKVWNVLGETEPHWSVLSSNDFKQESIVHNKKRFYDSGSADVDILRYALCRNNLSLDNYSTCLEYGCGLGRVTYHLAKIFDSVYGCDISSSHLESAFQYMVHQNVHNVQFIHIDSFESLKRLPKIDLIFSLIVLQHNPPPMIAKIIEIFTQKLNPEGVALFQLPVYRKGYRFCLHDYLETTADANMEIEMHILPQADVFKIIDAGGCRVLEVLTDKHVNPVSGIVSNTFLIIKK